MKKENFYSYEILFLANDSEKYWNFYKELEDFVGKDKVERSEKLKIKPSYKISGLENEIYYLFVFKLEKKKLKYLKENILEKVSKIIINRYHLKKIN